MKTKISAEAVLHILFAAFLAGIVLVAGVGYVATQRTHERGTAGLKAAADIGTALGLVRAADNAARTQITEFPQLLARAWSSSGQQEAVVALRARNELIQRQLEDAQQLLARNSLDASSLSEALQAQSKIVKDYEERLQQAIQGSTVDAAKVTWKDAAPSVERLAQQLNTRINEDHAAGSTALVWLFGGLVAAGFAMAAFFRWWIRRANVGPLIIATKLVQRVAAGDLTGRADNLDFQHTRRIAQALNEMTQNLRNLVGEVVHSAQTVADTSAQIAQGNLDLSQRTEEQASTLEETASSMEQLTSTVAQNADNAKQASQLAVEASDVARRGGQAVKQVVNTMTGISQASQRIGDIIGVIDGIAFQTNILALNAAVEAARAGEQGRGFAVVAQEVRNLAQRSAAAAKEIKGLIGDSVGRVEAGTRQVDAAGKTMEEIVDAVKRVSDLIAEIAAASREQSAGIGQINTAIAQMEQVVQQNASLVEEASAATESMKDQASALLSAVSRFQLGDEPPQPGPQPTEITPIQVKPGSTPLPRAYAAVLDNAKASRAPAPRAGGWEEF